MNSIINLHKIRMVFTGIPDIFKEDPDMISLLEKYASSMVSIDSYPSNRIIMGCDQVLHCGTYENFEDPVDNIVYMFKKWMSVFLQDPDHNTAIILILTLNENNKIVRVTEATKVIPSVICLRSKEYWNKAELIRRIDEFHCCIKDIPITDDIIKMYQT